MANIAIQESQLERWARYVQLNKNKETYAYVKSLFSGEYFNKRNDFEIYLQRSVANDTNIYADGDIDIVFQFNSTFYYKYDYTPNIYHPPLPTRLPTLPYDHDELRIGVKTMLSKKQIPHQENNKCIQLNIRGDKWQDVDLIPCFQYRNHHGSGEYAFFEGINVKARTGYVISYPKIHRKNGHAKNKKKNYKKIVRIFKNIKSKLVEENKMNKKLASSYFIECLIYNIPDENFNENTLVNTLCNCMNWLINAVNAHQLNDLKCQNEITDLFGSDNTQWDIDNCREFISNVAKFITTKDMAYMFFYITIINYFWIITRVS